MKHQRVNQNLSTYYATLPKVRSPKTEFLLEVADKCNVSMNAVRNWVNGYSKPCNPEHIQIISKITGIKPQNLF